MAYNEDDYARDSRRVVAALADAFARIDDPGVSDLYDGQPMSIHLPLGMLRLARTLSRRNPDGSLVAKERLDNV